MSEDGEVVHMIGKDIIRFHAVYWPAFLMAAGLPLPKTIFAHGWIYYEQDKMSKSKGNVVYPEPIVEALNSLGAPGNDALRYYLLRDTPFGQDASFSYEGLIQRYNSDLANDLGNLTSRTISMLDRYFDGRIPSTESVPDAADKVGSLMRMPPLKEYVNIVRQGSISAQKHVHASFNGSDFSLGIQEVWKLVSATNSFLVIFQPWDLAKDFEINRLSIATIIVEAAEAVKSCCILLYPVLPEGSTRTWKQLGCENYNGKIENQHIDRFEWGALKPGSRAGKPEPVFPRLDKAATLAKLQEFAEKDRVSVSVATVKPSADGLTVGSTTAKTHGQEGADRGYPGGNRKLTKKGTTVEQQPDNKPNPESRTPSFEPAAPPAGQSASAAPQPQADAKISIDDFAKVEMRVGEIVSAERIPKADKLLKIMVDIGTEVRQVCAGIAEYYEPEKLVGMKVVVVTNLQPRKLRGIESNGMIVAASVGPEGKPVLATFAEDVPKGARLK
jgi:methionyl-tRNA synthetase